MRTERLEEAAQRLFGAALGDPHDITGVVIGDDRQILVAAPTGDLVDTKVEQIIEAGLVEMVGDDIADDTVDGFPRAAHQPAHRRLVGALTQPGDDVFEVTGVPCPRPGPRHHFAAHPTRRALEAADLGLQPDLTGTGIEVSPAAPTGVIAGLGREPARTRQPPGPLTQSDDNTDIAEHERTPPTLPPA